MFSLPLTDAELETIIVALKYWRRHRSIDASRRGDRVLSAEAVELLLAKLEVGTLSTRPPDDDDLLADLFPR